MGFRHENIEDLIKSSPWRVLKKDGPYFLEQDAVDIAEFNERAQDDFLVRDRVIAEPFIESPYANVWLLNLNPGFDPRDLTHDDNAKEAQIKNLHLEARDFWYLDERYSNAEGYNWWRNSLKALFPEVDEVAVRQNVFCIEYFPYHSKRYKPLPRGKILHSQKFAAKLVRAGIGAKKTFLLMRGRARWLGLVDDLEKIIFEKIKNPRSKSVSPRNCDGFNRICDAILSQHGGVTR
jgi:hypothetical protein